MHHVMSTKCFIVPPELEIGDSAEFGSLQIYTCIALEKTQGGKTSIKWRSACHACGIEFFTHTGFITSGPSRNCATHKRVMKYKARERRKEVPLGNAKSIAITPGKAAPAKTMPVDKPSTVKASPSAYTGPLIMHNGAWLPEAEFHEVVKKERLESWAAQAKRDTVAPLSEEEERKQHREQWEKDKASNYLDDLLG